MKLFRQITTAGLALSFCMSMAVISGYSQPGRARWEGNRGQHRGWTVARYGRWDNRNRRNVRNNYYRYGSNRMSWRERRRLERRRYLRSLTRQRYYRNSYYGTRERRRSSYRRNSYRNARNW